MGHADHEISAAFSRFDRDGNQILDEDEQERMKIELEEKRVCIIVYTVWLDECDTFILHYHSIYLLSYLTWQAIKYRQSCVLRVFPCFGRMLFVLNSTILEWIMIKNYWRSLLQHPTSRRTTPVIPLWIGNSFKGEEKVLLLIYEMYCIRNELSHFQTRKIILITMDVNQTLNYLSLIMKDWLDRFSTLKALWQPSHPRLNWLWRNWDYERKLKGTKQQGNCLWPGMMWVW